MSAFLLRCNGPDVNHVLGAILGVVEQVLGALADARDDGIDFFWGRWEVRDC